MANAAVITGSPLRSTQGRVNSGARFWPSTVAVARRTVRKFVRTPQLIGLATVQSAIFLVIFRYIFGGAINAGGLPYVDFLVPGFVTTGILFAGMGAAAGVAEDLEQGLFDRLRSLPILRAAVLAGRGLADTALVTWSLAVGTALGFAVGFRLHGSVTAGLAAFGLCVLFGFAFEWVFITIGLVAGTAQAAQGMSVLMTLFVFVSGAYVPSAACRAGCRPSPSTSRSPPWSTRSAGWPAGPRRRRCLPTPLPITSGSPFALGEFRSGRPTRRPDGAAVSGPSGLGTASGGRSRRRRPIRWCEQIGETNLNTKGEIPYVCADGALQERSSRKRRRRRGGDQKGLLGDRAGAARGRPLRVEQARRRRRRQLRGAVEA
jgi:ABC-2 type transport system permease protein